MCVLREKREKKRERENKSECVFEKGNERERESVCERERTVKI